MRAIAGLLMLSLVACADGTSDAIGPRVQAGDAEHADSGAPPARASEAGSSDAGAPQDASGVDPSADAAVGASTDAGQPPSCLTVFPAPPSAPARETYATDGRVNDVARVGSAVFLRGIFSNALNPDGGTAPRTNFAVFDAATGGVQDYPKLDGAVLHSHLSDGVLYIVGDFANVTTESGTYARSGLAAFDASTGALTALSVAVPSGYVIEDVAAVDGTLYVRGWPPAAQDVDAPYDGIDCPGVSRFDTLSGAFIECPAYSREDNHSWAGLGGESQRIVTLKGPRAPRGLVVNYSSDGTVAVEMDPLSLLCRLAASVPPPKLHTVRYAGVLGSASRLRSRVVPTPPMTTAVKDAKEADDGYKPKSRYRPWAELMMRTLKLDVLECPRCRGRLTLVALVTDLDQARRFACTLGEPSQLPQRTAARGPPFWQSRVLRRLAGDAA